MPLLNSRGDVIMGGGGVPGSLNGQYYPFTTYGRGCFKDDNTIIAASVDQGAALVEWISWNKDYALIHPARYANGVAGNGGKWIGIGEGENKGSVLFGNTINDRQGAGFGSVALDGTIAFKTIYQSYYGVTIIDPLGYEVAIPNGNPADLYALPNGQAIGQNWAYGRPIPKPYFNVPLGLKLVTNSGIDWIIYWQNGIGLILQPDGMSEGYILETRDNAFNHDIIKWEDGVMIAWSWTAGEGPQDIVKLKANRNRVEFLIDPEGQYRKIPVWQSFVPVPPEPIPPKPEPPKPEPPKPLPIPEPKYPSAKVYRNKMETQKVALILVDGKYISFNSAGELNLFNDSINEDCKFDLSKPDNLWAIKKGDKWLGADATSHTPNVASQLYMIDHREGYESWNVEHPAGNPDLISAFIIFRRPEGINFSVKLRVVEL